MSDTAAPAPGLEQTRRLGVETTGIEIIEESERTARPRDLFWPWFAANVSVFGLSYASFVLYFGISFWQAVLVSVVGIVVSFLLCGIIAIAGKRGSAPTMILSRAAFGVQGQKVPGVISWLVSIGWETFLAILAVLATSTVFTRLGWGGGTGTKVVAAVVVAALIVSASVAGYHIIMRMQSLLTWVTGIVTVLYMALTLDDVDWTAVQAIPAGSTQSVIGALVMVMTGFGLGWINIAADWSRYQKRTAPGPSIVAWNTFGGALAPVVLVLFGLALAGSSTEILDGVAADPIGTLATLLPTWFLVPFLLAAILSLVSGAVLGIYSSGLTLLSLGVRLKRPQAAAVDGVLLTLGTIYVVFVAENFINPFQSFLITLGVPLAAWAGIMIADLALRRRDYDEDALFDGRGRYGAWDWAAIGTMVLASLVGWGLVINSFSDDASWNNWQGYLLGPLGLGGRDGAWAFANLGVLVALLIGLVLGYALRRGTVRRQES
ncbi:purine-cytosine permease-like protein [Nocardioides cavernae]|uniref:Purine-cytosine permease-like protein n=1 Tax=Nocardioides cavernae TaxID=1921566 RepID=A0A7Y9GZS9_9ACTN|nr:cytosine permease [Nocardioides cavernae]NYE35041.1 purine-cytosine permease-like protein [Nocardioides cavernae]